MIILVVDDQDTILEIVRDFLLSEEYVVITARSGAEALDILGDTSVDLLITDLGMDGMSGWELIEEVRRIGIPIKILAMSELGTDDYFLKSNMNLLLDKVRALLHGNV